jgi:hypothetical protein
VSDAQKVMKAIAEANGVISDACARVIASQWHGGQRSSLYSLSSCGAIDDRALSEIDQELGDREESGPEVKRPLIALRAYVLIKGQRGRQEGWSALWV